MVARLTGAVNYATYLNTISGNLFWTVCGSLCLFLVLFLYLKERFNTNAALTGSLWGVTFVTILLYFLNLVPQLLVYIFVVSAALSLVVLWL